MNQARAMEQVHTVPSFKHGPFFFESWEEHSISDGSVSSLSMHKAESTIVDTPQPLPPPPDGGLVAWTQVLMGHLLVFNGFGYVSSFGLFQAHYADTLGHPRSDISWVGSFQLFLLFFIGTLSGRAMDAGYFRSLIIAGCTMQLIGVFATSLATQYWQLFLAQGVMQGLGNGLLFTPTVSLIATYFSKKRAFALGLAACGAPTGGVAFPLIARQLTGKIGFPWTVRVMGFVILFNTAIVIVFVKPRLAPRPKGPLVEFAAFREKPYSLFAAGIFLALWGLYFAYYYLAVFGREVIKLDSQSSLNLLLTLNAVGIPGRLIPSLLADRYFGVYNTLLPFVLACGVLMFGWIGVDSYAALLGFTALYGACAHAVQTLFPATLSSLTTDLSKMGVRVGMVFTIISIATLTGPPIAGILIQTHGGSYLGAQLFGGTTLLCGLVLLVAGRIVQLRESRDRQAQEAAAATAAI
ncbi:MAG: hypothetical protein M1814_004224 [Vezdaea aestivalis]|nr:MAG: hypothetical protein M1814_004224 [Vezdaea aestivalis]